MMYAQVTPQQQVDEIAKCYRSPEYFIDEHVQIYDATKRDWIPFKLWPEQRQVLRDLEVYKLHVILKARQLGLTWLILAFELWLLKYRPITEAANFSRRDDEAVHLLDDRLKGMYKRLPAWMREGDTFPEDNSHEWQFNGGSIARAFPTTAGDSYTLTFALIDEADLIPDLPKLMSAVKPTIDGGGWLVLLSRSDKAKPASRFKAIFRSARLGKTSWYPTFLPWFVRPERTQEWYGRQKADVLETTGSLDELHEQYPATEEEALKAATLGKRIPHEWLERVYEPTELVEPHNKPAVPDLIIYEPPRLGREYVVGGDPAEGNPTSNDSAITVIDKDSKQEVASCNGKFQPAVFANYLDKIGTFYNRADLMVERNNHGHAVILWLDEHSTLPLCKGHDGKIGWMTSVRGKTLLYDYETEAFRDERPTLRTQMTYLQLASIGGGSLEAPEGEMDDLAVSHALANAGASFGESRRAYASSP